MWPVILRCASYALALLGGRSRAGAVDARVPVFRRACLQSPRRRPASSSRFVYVSPWFAQATRRKPQLRMSSQVRRALNRRVLKCSSGRSKCGTACVDDKSISRLDDRYAMVRLTSLVAFAQKPERAWRSMSKRKFRTTNTFGKSARTRAISRRRRRLMPSGPPSRHTSSLKP